MVLEDKQSVSADDLDNLKYIEQVNHVKIPYVGRWYFLPC